MHEALVHPDLSVKIRERAIPTPGKDEVLIKVVVFGLNPKDWKYPEWLDQIFNAGDDVAGYVEAVGEHVFQFKKGDRVAGYRHFSNPNGGFAEYAIVPSAAVFHIPESTSFEEAATIPLATMTAIYGLFDILKLPAPWHIAKEDTITSIPLLIYGASTAISAFAIKLAYLSNIHPIIAVGSKNSKFVTDRYLDPSRGDALIDYTKHDTPEELAEAIKHALIKAGVKDGRASHAFDGISDFGSYDKVLASVMGDGGARSETGSRPTVAVVLPPSAKTINGVDMIRVDAKSIHETGRVGRALAAAYYPVIARALQEGDFEAHPYEIIPEGFNGLSEALKRLKADKVRGLKLVGRVCDAPGL